MPRILNRVFNCLIVLCISFTCTSCKAVKPYLTSDYLNALAYRSGISQSENIDESINSLIDFQILDENDIYDEYLTYDFLALTINRLIENDDTSIKSLKEKGIIKRVKNGNDLVDQEIGEEAIDKAVSLINNKLIDKRQEFEYKEEIKYVNRYTLDNNCLVTDELYKLGDLIYLEDEDTYKVICGINYGSYMIRDAELDEIFESFIISDCEAIDLTRAIDVTEIEDSSSVYLNNDRNLLASSNTKRFSKDGFNISYKLAKSGINARISKNVDGLNFFFDVTVSNIKPSYVWNYTQGDVKNTYFKIDYKTVEEIGVSIGRYKNYYLDLKNLDSSSFMNLSKSIIKEKADEAEATIRICQLKVPISGVPTLYLNVELLAKFYVSGKVEIVVSNDSSKGFEVRNGKLRLINEIYRQYLMGMSSNDLSKEVKNTLDELRKNNFKLAIGSSSKNTKLILEKIGLNNYFDAISDGNDITKSKPDPEVFLKAADFLNLSPSECYVVEDAISGIDAANAGGFCSIGIGEASKFAKTDHPINKFSEILKVVKE